MPGVVELGMQGVHVHPPILSSKEAKPVPSMGLLLICVPPDSQPFRRPWMCSGTMF